MKKIIEMVRWMAWYCYMAPSALSVFLRHDWKTMKKYLSMEVVMSEIMSEREFFGLFQRVRLQNKQNKLEASTNCKN